MWRVCERYTRDCDDVTNLKLDLYTLRLVRISSFFCYI